MQLSKSRSSLIYLLVFGLAIRLAVLFLYPDQHLPDVDVYIEAGKALFDTGILGTEKYMALYPIWAHITGGGLGLKIADIALSTLTIALIYQVTLEIFENRGTAVLAGLFAAVYPHFVFYSVSRLSETPYVFLTCLAFILLYRQRFWLGCIVLVLSIHVRPSIDFLAPILIISFAVLTHRLPKQETIGHVLKYVAVYLIFMAPWWVHNYAKYDTFIRLNVGDGIVIYSGNNPMNRSGGGVAYGGPNDDMDLSIFNHIEDPVERNDAMKKAAFDFIKENPGRFVELAGIKFVRFWRLWPYAPAYQKPLYIVASLLSYGVILALCLVGMGRALKERWRQLVPIFLFSGYLLFVHMVTISSVRYRLPVEPFMIVIAAATARELLAKWGWTRQWVLDKIEQPD